MQLIGPPFLPRGPNIPDRRAISPTHFARPSALQRSSKLILTPPSELFRPPASQWGPSPTRIASFRNCFSATRARFGPPYRSFLVCLTCLLSAVSSIQRPIAVTIDPFVTLGFPDFQFRAPARYSILVSVVLGARPYWYTNGQIIPMVHSDAFPHL